MKTFREFLYESQELKDSTHFSICHSTIQKNPSIQVSDDYELKRVTKEEALRLTDKVIFVKYFNKEYDDVFWYCSTPSENGRNYYIPDNFVLDGYARSTREQCIRNGVDWICVN